MLSRLLVVAGLVAAACLPDDVRPPDTPSASPTDPAPLDMSAVLRSKPLPLADMFELVRTMEGRSGQPERMFEPVRLEPSDEDVGAVAEFWVYDFAARSSLQMAATLRLQTANAKWWVADEATVADAALAASAEVFQERIYPTNRAIFGEEWSPGIDADPRVSILIAPIPGGAAGYFHSIDSLPRWVNERSNEREMLYVNSQAARLGTDGFHAVLAHEMCHMQEFNRRVRNATWFNEGQAQLCERANGYSIGFEDIFLRRPDTQLNTWTQIEQGAAAHYGAAYLFVEYLRHRAGGGYDVILELLERGVGTLGDLEPVLVRRGLGGVDEAVADFVAANALIGRDAPERYSYPAELDLPFAARPADADRVGLGESHRTSVRQHAARYIQLPEGGRYRVTFEGTRTTPVIPTTAHSAAAFWWSDRADRLDSRLERSVDLRGVDSATLTFWTWYDIESDFDFAYVAASIDGGATWRTLEGTSTTTEDAHGLNLGHAFTGRSGGGRSSIWVEERIDLTPFSGSEVLLRFQHVTDAALNHPGFAIDDIAIPEIGFRDDAEADDGWTAEGFVRSTNVVKQRYAVQLIRFADEPTVERHFVEDGTLELEVNVGDDELAPILAVTGLAPRTTLSAAFEVRVEELP